MGHVPARHAAEAGGEVRPPKYANRKVEVDGIKFDSTKEAARYSQLRLLERAGHISGLEVHPKFPFVVNGHRVGSYSADFRYRQHGEVVVEDVKSPVTRKLPLYRFKIKLLKALHGVEVSEV